VRNMLSKKQLKDVCMLYSSGFKQCRYLRIDSFDSQCYCLKLKVSDKKKIDVKVNDFLRECRKKGVDPYAQNVPMGDNCNGYPILKIIEQGYDKD